MKSFLKNYFTAQYKEENSNNRPLVFLQIVLKYGLAATVVIIPISFFNDRVVTFYVSLFVFIIILLSLYLMRIGYLRSASFLSLFTFVLTAMITSYIGDGINDISMLLIPGILVVAALLLDKKIYLVFSFIAISTIGFIPLLRNYYGLNNLHGDELVAEIVTATVILIAIAAGIRVLFVNLIETLKKSQINENKYRDIFENIQDIFYEISLDGKIIEISPGIKSLLGINRKDLLGKSIREFYEKPEFYDQFVDELNAFQQVANIETRLEDKGQNTHIVSINATLKENMTTSDQLIVGTIRDITEKKSLEAQLLQSQKLDSIGRLAGGVAHDFNNLLTIISGHSELAIEKRYQETGELDEDLQAIKSAGAKATGLTRQLLAFSRNQVYEPQIINPNLIIGDLEKMLRRVIGEDINIQVQLSTDTGILIEADPTQIEQIIMNLVVNARDAIKLVSRSKGEKRISIKTTKEEIDRYYSDQNLESIPGNYFTISVNDTGIGMKPRVQQNIFEPFFTTKKEGTGLGLSMVYGIVKQNKGFVTVYSEENIGTSLKIYWPLKEGKTISYKKNVDKAQLRGNECILLAEDDDQVRFYASTVLKSYGYQVLESVNGQEAEKMFKEKKSDIHLVISDMIMPKMSGLELSEKLIKIKKDIKILFISGYTDNHISYNEILKSEVNYLQKPFSGKDLISKVRDILDNPRVS
jgi:PAS domain S-box-containing protein